MSEPEVTPAPEPVDAESDEPDEVTLAQLDEGVEVEAQDGEIVLVVEPPFLFSA